MAFSLPSKQAVGKSLGSVAAGEVVELAELLRAPYGAGSPAERTELDERVHVARKVIKRLRALLRLYRGALDRALFVREDAWLRALGRSLGRARDEAALRESFARLVEAARGSERAGLGDGLPALSGALGVHAAPAADAQTSFDAVHDALDVIREALGTFAERAARFRIERSGWPAIASGFRRTYAGGHRALRRARRKPSEKRLHALRRAVKRHQAHLSLLEPLWPAPIKAARHEVSLLGDLLGEEHDLSLLERRFDGLRKQPELAAFQPSFRSAAAARHAELRRRVFELASRVYAESPGRLAARFHDYFDAWA